MKNEALNGSYMQDALKDRPSSIPRDFISFRKAADENQFSRQPTQVATEARNKLLYQSNVRQDKLMNLKNKPDPCKKEWNRAPSKVSTEGRNKLIYTTSFKLE